MPNSPRRPFTDIQLPPAAELVRRFIEGLRHRKPSPKSRARQPDPLWSRVGAATGHGSGYSWAICLEYGFNPDETWKEG